MLVEAASQPPVSQGAPEWRGRLGSETIGTCGADVLPGRSQTDTDRRGHRPYDSSGAARQSPKEGLREHFGAYFKYRSFHL